MHSMRHESQNKVKSNRNDTVRVNEPIKEALIISFKLQDGINARSYRQCLCFFQNLVLVCPHRLSKKSFVRFNTAQTKKLAPFVKKLVKSTCNKSIGLMLNQIYDTLTKPVLKQAACIIQYSGTAGKIIITRSPGSISAAAHSKLAVLERRKSKGDYNL